MSVPAWAGAYAGIEFDKSRTHGEDCWGLVRRVYRDQLGVDLPHYAEVSPHRLRQIARRLRRPPDDWRKLESIDQAKAFDALLMFGHVKDTRGRPTRAPLHVGVMVDTRQVLHVEEATAAVIVSVDHHSIRNRIVGVYRHQGNENV